MTHSITPVVSVPRLSKALSGPSRPVVCRHCGHTDPDPEVSVPDCDRCVSPRRFALMVSGYGCISAVRVGSSFHYDPRGRRECGRVNVPRRLEAEPFIRAAVLTLVATPVPDRRSS